MKFLWIKKEIPYEGSQLRSHWIRETTGIEGDGIAVFTGECDVSVENLVDLEDKLLQKPIKAKKMIHFIVEIFTANLIEINLWQRLLVCIAKESIEEVTGLKIRREGDDLYLNHGKLSVSIATVSPVSGLIHLGINLNHQGAPVKASSLPQNINAKELAHSISSKFINEYESLKKAISKVRWVK